MFDDSREQCSIYSKDHLIKFKLSHAQRANRLFETHKFRCSVSLGPTEVAQVVEGSNLLFFFSFSAFRSSLSFSLSSLKLLGRVSYTRSLILGEFLSLTKQLNNILTSLAVVVAQW